MSTENPALRRFMRRVWRDDIAPLLNDRRAAQRRKTARAGGKLAAATGLLVDGVFRLRGKPFTRFMTVVGSSLGAMLPDVWDWKWLRDEASRDEREVVAERVRIRAGRLRNREALELFDLDETASREDLKRAWRRVARRWHPDRAQDPERRAEHHVRFLACQSAYETLRRAYDEGLLPRDAAR